MTEDQELQIAQRALKDAAENLGTETAISLLMDDLPPERLDDLLHRELGNRT